MISTQNLKQLPHPEKLRTICKARSVLDAILCQDWEDRYFSFNKKWAKGEEFCEMRNGSGDELKILFQKDGCVINGFAHEEKQPDKSLVLKGLPKQYAKFLSEEPVKSAGTTFCIWSEKNIWKTNKTGKSDDGSKDLLSFLEEDPKNYIKWAEEYFDGSYKGKGIPLKTVTQIYAGEKLTEAMVLSIVDELEDWDQLADDLEEIGYPYEF